MSDSGFTLPGVDAAVEKITELVYDLVGPSAKVVGEILADPLRVYQWKRQQKLIQHVKEHAIKQNIPLKATRAPVLIPLLQHAAIEDEESMQKRWAALLLSAVRADRPREIPPSFPGILAQVSPDEARVLDALAEVGAALLDDLDRPFGESHQGLSLNQIGKLYAGDWPVYMGDAGRLEPGRWDRLRIDFGIILDNLIRLELVRRVDNVELAHRPPIPGLGNDLNLPKVLTYSRYGISWLGQELVRACRAPKDDMYTCLASGPEPPY